MTMNETLQLIIAYLLALTSLGVVLFYRPKKKDG